MSNTRREFLGSALAAGAAAAFGGSSAIADRKGVADGGKKGTGFEISLAEWSFHKMLFAKKLDHLDFPKMAKETCGIDACEYVNQFFKDKADDEKYLAELKKRCTDLGVRSVLIMCDGEGDLGDPDSKKRHKAVENHHKWVRAAKFLGCHSIRVNAYSKGSPEEQHKLVVDGLSSLVDYGKQHNLSIIVENHGGQSSDGEWLAGVMKAVNSPYCGTLPDFGNFGQFDRYKGVAAMMPFAKGVSAKSFDFNDSGEETTIDYKRIMKIVLDAGYHARVGIEYEGNRMGELEGVMATKKLLERLRNELA